MLHTHLFLFILLLSYHLPYIFGSYKIKQNLKQKCNISFFIRSPAEGLQCHKWCIMQNTFFKKYKLNNVRSLICLVVLFVSIIPNYRWLVGSFLWIIDTRHRPCQPHSLPQFPHLPCRDRQDRDYIISCLNLLCFKAWDLLARPFCCRAEPGETRFQALIYQASVDILLFHLD